MMTAPTQNTGDLEAHGLPEFSPSTPGTTRRSHPERGPSRSRGPDFRAEAVAAISRDGPTPLDNSLALLEVAHDLIAVVEAPGLLVFANRALRSAVGTADDLLKGRHLFEIIHPSDHAACRDWLRRGFLGETQDGASLPGPRIRLLVRRPGLGELAVDCCLVPSSPGPEPARLQLLFHSDSGDSHLGKPVAGLKEMCALVDECAPWGVFVTDETGRVRQSNARWRAITEGFVVSNPRGAWWQVVHPEDRNRVVAQWHSALSSGHEFASTYRLASTAAKPRWLRTCIAQSHPAGGTPGPCIGFTQDVTHERQTETDLRRAHEYLADLLHDRTEQLHETRGELDQLVHAVTHDLRSPLRGISRLTDWLVEDHSAELAPDGGTLIVKIQERIQHLHCLLDAIQTYSRVGRTHEPSTAVDLAAVVDEVIRQLKAPADFVVHVPEPLPTLEGSAQHFHQIFRHLLENAVRFMDKPGGRVLITRQKTDRAWKFSISDNGPGIAPGRQRNIFQLFHRLDSSPDQQGIGLGLALVRRLVETHGGRISVSSEPGSGSTFHLTWPDKVSLKS